MIGKKFHFIAAFVGGICKPKAGTFCRSVDFDDDYFWLLVYLHLGYVFQSAVVVW
jgi:hypothetical protein